MTTKSIDLTPPVTVAKPVGDNNEVVAQPTRKHNPSDIFIFGAVVLLHLTYYDGIISVIITAILAIIIGFIIEYILIHITQDLSHIIAPIGRVLDIPLNILYAWIILLVMIYDITAALTLSSLWRDVLCAVLALAMDILLDPLALDLGFFIWKHGGATVTTVTGKNGRRGIPVVNWICWFLAAYAFSYGRRLLTTAYTQSLSRVFVCVVLIGLYYGRGVEWALKTKRYELIALSVPLALSLVFVLRLSFIETITAFSR